MDRLDPGCPPEPERPLTPRGIEKTRAAALGLRALSIKPDAIFTSPYLRAAQTAEIACEALGFPLKKVRRSDALKPGGDPAEFFKELARVRAKEVMCFGHAPQLDRLIARAVGAPSAFTALKKAGVACLELKTLTPPKGQLVWLYQPKALRRVGKQAFLAHSDAREAPPA